jgi:nicotinamide-nucleotide amidase
MGMADQLAQEVAELARRRSLRVAVAESLTGGEISRRLAAAPDSSEWFVGGVVAYAEDVKFGLLGVDPGPVVTEACARQMAAGVADLLHAGIAIAVTGVGGPNPEEGQPPGTVWLATARGAAVHAQRHDLTGEPASIVEQTTELALRALVANCREAAETSPDAGREPRPSPGDGSAGSAPDRAMETISFPCPTEGCSGTVTATAGPVLGGQEWAVRHVDGTPDVRCSESCTSPTDLEERVKAALQAG